MKVLNAVFCIMICTCLLIPSTIFAADSIVLANGEWAPYLGKDLKHGGPTSHAVSEAFKQGGINVTYKWYGDSWKRAYHDTLSGQKAQGTLVWSKKAEREKEMYYSKGILVPGKKTVLFYLKKKAFDWQSIQDLKGLKIAGRLGYTYGEKFDAAIDAGTFKFERVDKDEINFKKLLAGRVDLVISVLNAGEESLKKEFTPEQVSQVTYHQTPARIAGYHLLLTKELPENEALMKKFDEGLKKIQANGTFDKIMADMKAGVYN